MANQTVTTAVNYDDAAISGLLNGETITINGGSLTINADVRWNQQAAVFGSITCSATLGGYVAIDGTQVWELYFTASTGNVPAQGALGTNGVTGGTSGATGELTRVWATGNLEPSAAGGAMPATGWIKLRSKVGGFQAGEVVTLPGGATITITDAGRRSWIHVVGRQSLAITPSKLNDSSMTGDWYELGTTNGADDQTFQFPVADYCPAIQIETAVGSGVYEWWLHAPEGVRWGTATQFVSTDVRGKYFGIDPTTGIITIARRATNACGFKPVSGLKVRIPNIICSSAATTNYAVNVISSAANATRYRSFLGTNNPNISVDKICSNWYWSAINANNITITNSAMMPFIQNQLSTGVVTMDNLGVGCLPFVFSLNISIQVAQCFVGGTLSNLRVGMLVISTADDSTISISNSYNFTVTDCQFETFGSISSVERGAVAYTFLTSRCGAMTLTNLTMIGAGGLFNTHLEPVSLTNVTYADRLNGTTTSAVPSAVMALSTCPQFVFTGPLNWFGGLTGLPSYGTLISVVSGSSDCIFQNIGTPSTPLDCQNLSERLASVSSSRNTIIRRCYTQNVRVSNFISASVDCKNTQVDNCSTDYTDTQQTVGTNSRFRGLKCTNSTSGATAVSGTEFFDCFTSATTGRIVFAGNAGNAESGNDIATSFGPNSNFTGAGSVVMVNLNDSVTWTMSYFALGHTGFQNTTPTFTGTNPANFTIEFQYDVGSGFNGTWLAATGANLSGIGAIDPAIGVKLKVRATVNTASTSNAITFIRFDTTTTSTDQDTLYPLPFDGIGDIDNLVAGSRIQIYNNTTSTELDNVVVAGTSYSYSYYVGTQVSVGDEVRIRVAKLGYLPQTLIAIATSTGFSAAANQQTDSIYVANGIDGSTVTEFTADYPNIDLEINDPDQVTTVQRIYAFLRYTETTQDGIDQWFDVVDPTDEVNYEIDATKLDLKFDNTQATPVIIGGGRIYRSDAATIIESVSGSIQMDPQRVYQSSQAFTAEELADTVLRRSTANVEASGTGDPVSLKSLYGMVAQGVHNTQVTGATLTVTKSDDATVLGTRTVTTNPNAEPITGIDSD